MKKKGELQLNKWHFKLGIIPIYWRTHGFWFHFGIFKLLRFPPEGEKISKAQYKGFWLRKEFEIRGIEISF